MHATTVLLAGLIPAIPLVLTDPDPLARDVSAATTTRLDVSVARAPIAPDGTTAGAVTDFVLTFVDRDPRVDGIALPSGSTVEVDLPPAFVNSGSGQNTAIILQGWPQSPIVPFPYRLDVDGNRITLTLTADFRRGSDGEGGPGPKQVHLLLESFTNPRAGRYRIPLRIAATTGRQYSGTGIVRIIRRARPSANIVSFASGGGPPPPFNNPVYQTVMQGNDALLTRLFVWDSDSVPFVGVDLVPTFFRRLYFLRQGRRFVGHVWIHPPRRARRYSLTTTGPSVVVPNPIIGVPTGGLDTQFHPDSQARGRYVIKFRMYFGNTQQQIVDVR